MERLSGLLLVAAGVLVLVFRRRCARVNEEESGKSNAAPSPRVGQWAYYVPVYVVAVGLVAGGLSLLLGLARWR
jgi:hypothetical protein